MKKYLFISFMALVALVFSGCESSEPCRYKKMTVDIPVSANDWQFDNENNQYFVHVPVKELTAAAYDFGNISVSREYHKGTADAFQVALPETTYKQTTVEGNDYLYQQHIDYAAAVGFVEIIITISDFFYDDYKPEAMDFRMQIIY